MAVVDTVLGLGHPGIVIAGSQSEMSIGIEF